MIVRKMGAEDQRYVELVSSVAFESPYDPTAPVDWEDRLAKAESDPHDRSTLDWRERYGAFDETTGDLMATIHCKYYPLRYNGHAVAMCGIGGVSTLPEYRRQGAIRGCFAEAFPDMKKRGALLSQLYPFSDAFYRQFGYENFLRVHNWEIPLSSLRSAPVSGKLESFRVGGDWRPYAAVHEAMDARFELSSVREPVDWKPFAAQNPSKTRQYTYLYRAADGAPKGYLTFGRDTDAQGRRVMNCQGGFGNLYDFQFADAEGLTGLLAFVKTFSSNFDVVRFTLPETLDIEPFLYMHNPVRISRCYRAEGRVVDAEQALRLSAYRGDGEAKLAIADELCPWNAGVWRVRFANGAAVEAGRVEGEPDVSLTIQDFTRLIFGGFDASELWLLPEVKAAHPERLVGVFYRKPAWLAELF